MLENDNQDIPDDLRKRKIPSKFLNKTSKHKIASHFIRNSINTKFIEFLNLHKDISFLLKSDNQNRINKYYRFLIESYLKELLEQNKLAEDTPENLILEFLDTIPSFVKAEVELYNGLKKYNGKFDIKLIKSLLPCVNKKQFNIKFYNIFGKYNSSYLNFFTKKYLDIYISNIRANYKVLIIQNKLSPYILQPEVNSEIKSLNEDFNKKVERICKEELSILKQNNPRSGNLILSLNDYDLILKYTIQYFSNLTVPKISHEFWKLNIDNATITFIYHEIFVKLYPDTKYKISLFQFLSKIYPQLKLSNLDEANFRKHNCYKNFKRKSDNYKDLQKNKNK